MASSTPQEELVARIREDAGRPDAIAAFLDGLSNVDRIVAIRGVGRSDQSALGGLIFHDTEWIQAACAARGLRCRALEEYIIHHQVWLRIER